MNQNKNSLALIAFGLLLAAILVPFCIFVFGYGDFPLSFSAVAGMLALSLGAFSRSASLGKVVSVGLLLIIIVGVAATFIFSTIRVRQLRAENLARLKAEQERFIAEIERHK